MKMTCLALLVAGVLGSGAAFAQTCGAPGSWNPDAAGNPPVDTDLCAGSDSVALYCQFLDSAGKNDGIYQINLVAGYSATTIGVSGAAAGFNPVIYLYTAACATGDGCVQSGDSGTPIPLAGTAPGAYFLAVTAAASDATGACGVTQMTTNGTFPVSLQNFSVE
jgi:hypothetical protein